MKRIRSEDLSPEEKKWLDDWDSKMLLEMYEEMSEDRKNDPLLGKIWEKHDNLTSKEKVEVMRKMRRDIMGA